MKTKIAALLIVIVAFASCSKDSVQISAGAQLEIDKKAIREYLTQSGINAIEDSTGFFYVVNKLGKGLKPSSTAVVTTQSVGKFLNGTIFLLDTIGYKYTINTSFFPGLQTGIQLMPKGSNFTFYFPSGLAYGPYGNYDGSVGANTNVRFDIALFDDDAQLVKDDSVIDNYLKDVEDVIKDPSGLRYIILDAGTGVVPISSSKVTVDYTVSTMFPSNQVDQGTNFSVFLSDPIIDGWKLGIPKIKTNGHILLYIPSTLGYGLAGSQNKVIGRNKILFSDIKLKGVN